MAQHIYDENGNYKGKILSQEEHNKESITGDSTPIWESRVAVVVLLYLFTPLGIWFMHLGKHWDRKTRKIVTIFGWIFYIGLLIFLRYNQIT